jgi:signal transduction histidine kinase
MTLGSFGPNLVQIVVADQGVGFQPTEYPAGTSSNPSGGGFGLFSIRERLTLLGGSVDIESKPGSGTRITLTAPCPPVRQYVCGCDA